MTDKERIKAEISLLEQQLAFIETAERQNNSLPEEPVSESLIDGIVKEAITWTWGEYCNELDTFRISKKDLRTFTQSIIYSLGEKGIKI